MAADKKRKPDDYTPEHLDDTPPRRVPKDKWRKMTTSQKNSHLKWVRDYMADLEDEKRSKKRGTYGY